MVDSEAQKEIERLLPVYEHRWGKPLDWTVSPPRMTDTQFAKVLKRIVDTGESIVVGYGKVFLGK